MPQAIREFHQYITPDGEVYELHTASRIGRWVISATGYGTPPIDYLTQRGPFQDGETVKDFFLRPRTIQLLINQSFCNRNDYWAGRASLLDAIRPNRQAVFTGTTPGVLRRRLSDGSIRDLDVFIAKGPEFTPSPGGWREHSFHELLRFIAYNPVIYDPSLQSQAFNFTGIPCGLICPFICPFSFDYHTTTANLTYGGTWHSYPTIVINGPVTNPFITNVTTDETIEIEAAVATGENITINLAYGFKTVVDTFGNSLIGLVTTDSDLATWHLAVNPEAPGGVNEILAGGSNIAVGTTLFTISYNTRYFGI